MGDEFWIFQVEGSQNWRCLAEGWTFGMGGMKFRSCLLRTDEGQE